MAKQLFIIKELNKMKYNFTFRMTSDGDTFNETYYGQTFEQMENQKKSLEELKIKVHNIWKYGSGEISSDRIMIYSNNKGWV